MSYADFNAARQRVLSWLAERFKSDWTPAKPPVFWAVELLNMSDEDTARLLIEKLLDDGVIKPFDWDEWESNRPPSRATFWEARPRPTVWVLTRSPFPHGWYEITSDVLDAAPKLTDGKPEQADDDGKPIQQPVGKRRTKTGESKRQAVRELLTARPTITRDALRDELEARGISIGNDLLSLLMREFKP